MSDGNRERLRRELIRVRTNRILLVLLITIVAGMVLLVSCRSGQQHDREEMTAEQTSGDGSQNVAGTPDEQMTGGAEGEPSEADTAEGETAETETAEEQTTEVETAEAETTTEESPRNYVVCLDAGHGGNHGAISPLDGRFESDDTLRLTLAVQRELSKYENVTIVMTRTEDVDVSLDRRAEIANEADADLFVSIHRNSNTSGLVGGVEGWIHSSNPEDSRAVGEMILAALEAVGITDNRGVGSGTGDDPTANYKVIRLAEMPAVLLEVGYLNYAQDNQLFDQHLDGYAKAIADSIYAWLNEWVAR